MGSRETMRRLLVDEVERSGERQYVLAGLAGISAKHLNQMLQGRVGINPDHLDSILAACGRRLVLGTAPIEEEADG